MNTEPTAYSYIRFSTPSAPFFVCLKFQLKPSLTKGEQYKIYNLKGGLLSGGLTAPNSSFLFNLEDLCST